jgi:hypothetical protein
MKAGRFASRRERWSTVLTVTVTNSKAMPTV